MEVVPRKKVILLAVLCFSFLGVGVDGRRNTAATEKDLAVEKKLKLLNKPAVKTIKSEDGDIIDCVDIYKQPAFDHPLLKNHTIKMRPSEEFFTKLAEAYPNSPTDMPQQAWLKRGRCPEGTIPILRVQKHHLLNTTSLETYGRKPSLKFTKHENKSLNGSYFFSADHLHEVSTLVGEGYSYIGATAGINVWNPHVEANDEYSASQLVISNGPFGDPDTIEAGWIVYPNLYDDRATRFYLHWSAKGGEGCFNLMCPGFVQTNPDIALGAIISAISSEGGPQYQINLTLLKDFEDDDKWWAISGTGDAIGYWPTNIFKSLSKVGELVLFGGDVFSPRMKQQPPHTTTGMGSGQLAYFHWRFSCFIKQPRIMDYSKTFKYPEPGQTFSNHVDCYSGENYADIRFTEPFFYFGGPGRNMYCP
ncbi:protein neprosin-like [Typha latifolia]|uniref:protein neprosin-like n=1 Tax=Typha latifolia TaxID=4733 RepID=UPI003C30824C